MPNEDELRERLYDAYKHRALLYWHIFDELRDEIGQERAAEVMKRAIYRRGRETGQKYARFGPDDVLGLKEAFVGGSADQGRMFQPRVDRADAEAVDITHQACPLKEAWQEAGLSDPDVATLCEIAATIDQGKFDAAGVDFSCDTWRPGREGCCQLHFRPKRQP
jgi:hypothetical protein